MGHLLIEPEVRKLIVYENYELSPRIILTKIQNTKSIV